MVLGATEGTHKEDEMRLLIGLMIGILFISCAAPKSQQEQEDEKFIAQYQKDQAEKSASLAKFDGTPSVEIVSAYNKNKFSMKSQYMDKEICIKDLKLYNFNEMYSALAVYPTMPETKDGLVHYEFICEGEKTESELSTYRKDFGQICGVIKDVKTSKIFTPTKYLTQFIVNPCTIKQ